MVSKTLKQLAIHVQLVKLTDRSLMVGIENSDCEICFNIILYQICYYVTNGQERLKFKPYKADFILKWKQKQPHNTFFLHPTMQFEPNDIIWGGKVLS